MYKIVSVLENEKHNSLCDFDIQTDHQIPVRKLHLEIINNNNNNNNKKQTKDNLLYRIIFHPGGLQSENQRKWKES